MTSQQSKKWLIVGALSLAVAGVGIIASHIDYSQEPHGLNLLGGGYYSYAPAGDGSTNPTDMVPAEQQLSTEEIEQVVAEMDKAHEENMRQHPEWFTEAPAPDQSGSGARNGGKNEYISRIELATLNIESARVELEEAPHSVGGLITSYVPGLAVIHPGIENGPVNIEIRALERAPQQVDPGWEDISEISFWAGNDARTSIRGIEEYSETDQKQWVQRLDGHGEGWYRLRVHAKGRDKEAGEWVTTPTESYLFTSWPAPKAEPRVLKMASDVANYAAS